MDANKKIDLINAYRQLQGISLKLAKSTPEEIQGIVQTEFQAFVNFRIQELLNGKAAEPEAPVQIPASQLTDDDVQILLALVDNVKSKQKLNEAANSSSTPPRRPQQAPRPSSPNARPLKERDSDPTGERTRAANEGLLRQLQKMENEGPEF